VRAEAGCGALHSIRGRGISGSSPPGPNSLRRSSVCGEIIYAGGSICGAGRARELLPRTGDIGGSSRGV
jgi:hypothetical protein